MAFYLCSNRCHERSEISIHHLGARGGSHQPYMSIGANHDDGARGGIDAKRGKPSSTYSPVHVVVVQEYPTDKCVTTDELPIEDAATHFDQCGRSTFGKSVNVQYSIRPPYRGNHG